MNTASTQSDIDLLILLPDSYQGSDFIRRGTQIVDTLYDVEIDESVKISPLVLIKGIWERHIHISSMVNKQVSMSYRDSTEALIRSTFVMNSLWS